MLCSVLFTENESLEGAELADLGREVPEAVPGEVEGPEGLEGADLGWEGGEIVAGEGEDLEVRAGEDRAGDGREVQGVGVELREGAESHPRGEGRDARVADVQDTQLGKVGEDVDGRVPGNAQAGELLERLELVRDAAEVVVRDVQCRQRGHLPDAVGDDGDVVVREVQVPHVVELDKPVGELALVAVGEVQLWRW